MRGAGGLSGGAGTGRVRALDGLRGLAVAAVIVFHADVGALPGGFLAVSAFFTLSGFLITTLLLREHAALGTIRLGAFWARRARRLLPAALVTLAAVLAFGGLAADAAQVRDLRGDVLGALGYVANWRFLADGRDYTELFDTPSPVLHFWSLAIEEQFYVVFPPVLAALAWAARGSRAVLVAVLAAGAAGSVVLSRALAGDPSRVYFGTDTRAAELLVGAVLALAVAGRPAPRRPGTRFVLTAAGAAALTAVAVLWCTAERTDAWLYRGGFALHAVLVAVVLAAVVAGTPVARPLAAAPLVALGRVSYGAYLYHWPLFLWLTPERVGLPAPQLFALRCLLTLSAAVVSYLFLEQPVLAGRPASAAARRLAAGATAAVATALVLVTVSPPPPPFVLEPVAVRPPSAAPDPAPPAARGPAAPRAAAVAARAADAAGTAAAWHRPLDAPRPVRVMVVGDSVAMTLGRGLELFARETGRVVVRNEARKWCSLARHAPRIAGYGETRQSHGCDDWAARWHAAIDEFDPDAVVVLYTIWELVPRRVPGAEVFLEPGSPTFDRWQLREYEAAADVLTARGAVATWLTIPCSPDTPAGPGTPLARVNGGTIARLDRRRDDVRVLDLADRICPGGAFGPAFASPDALPDGRHFSDAGALEAARWMMPILLGDAAASGAPPTATP